MARDIVLYLFRGEKNSRHVDPAPFLGVSPGQRFEYPRQPLSAVYKKIVLKTKWQLSQTSWTVSEV